MSNPQRKAEAESPQTRQDAVEIDLATRQKDEDVRRDVSLVIAQSFQGPLPPPDLLEYYQEVRPDLVDKIVDMATTQQTRVHDLNVAALQATIEDRRADHLDRRRGQTFAFALTLLFGGRGFFWLSMGKKSLDHSFP